MKMLRVVELFSGIGAWSKALQRLNVPHIVVDAIEIDKKTMESYNLIHKTNFEARDITCVDENSVPDCDIIFYSPPCQSWSKVGEMKGFNDERGILFFDALRIIATKKPKIAVMENVSNLATSRFKYEFKEMFKSLELVGYKNYVQIMNPIDYNFPQSRERLFIVSIRKDIKDDFKFPERECLTKSFVNYLIDDYDGYLHSDKAIAYMNRTTTRGRTHWDFNHHNDTNNQYSKCITANFKKGVPYNVLIDRRNGKVVRKHTSLEVMRLMGFDDADHAILKANKISDTMIYQMAGNSIVVDIVEKILKNVILTVDKYKK